MPAPYILIGDCLALLPDLEPDSVDAIVTDPPYMLGFMGKDFDRPKDNVAVDVTLWQAALQVAKPGAHLLAFGGTRTHHRLMCAIEDAGWEIRDCLGWLYGSGFPKSLDVSKAIDKAAGVDRERIGQKIYPDGTKGHIGNRSGGNDAWKRPWQERCKDDWQGNQLTAPATDAARQWSGWGTALKPAWEPIILARKPLTGTVADNVLRWGCGGLNIDGCRIPIFLNEAQTSKDFRTTAATKHMVFGDGSPGHYRPSGEKKVVHQNHPLSLRHCAAGRWPANIVHDGSEEVLGYFPVSVARPGKPENIGKSGDGSRRGMFGNISIVHTGYYDTETSAARFFYCAKASRADREEGLEGFKLVKAGAMNGAETRPDRPTNHPNRGNHHPTVKPTALMRYLVRLITPPGGLVLDPFTGSGSTGKAAVLEGFRFLGIEQDAEYAAIAEARIRHAQAQARLPLAEAP